MKKGKDYIGVGAGAVIVNDNDEILLLLRNKEPEAGCWSIPGGAVEFFETLEDAIVREVKEEVGVTAEVIGLLGVTNHIIPEEGLHWVTTPFLVKIKEGIPTNLEPQKHLDLRRFPVNNLSENITMTTKKALEGFTKWRIKNNFEEAEGMHIVRKDKVKKPVINSSGEHVFEMTANPSELGGAI